MRRWEYRKVLMLSWGLLIFGPCMCLYGDTRHPGNTEDKVITQLASPTNIIQYVRDRFEIPESTRVEAAPVEHSPVPHFYQTVVTVDDGKQRRAINAFITEDAQCFALGSIFALNGASEAEIVRCVREAAALPATAKVTVGAFMGTPFKDLLRSTVTVEQTGKAEKGEIYVTRDRRVGILGLALPFRRDFVEQLIDTKNQPSIGPAQAAVTIVEYADLECPGAHYFKSSWKPSSCRSITRKCELSLRSSRFPFTRGQPPPQWQTSALIKLIRAPSSTIER